jgi:NDP-sugar pyrophosphorylase family protein
MMPVAILCGGYGTRAQQPINKCFVDVGGKPFILWIMERYEAQGFTTFVLCRGTSGTLAALRDAREQLGERFILNYGDTLLRLNLKDFVARWDNSKSPSITAIYDKIDAGVNGFMTHTLDMLDEDVTDLKVLQQELKMRAMTCHYDAPLPYLEVGTPQALAHTKRELLVT